MTDERKDDARELIKVMLEEYRRLAGEVSTRLSGLASLLGFLTAGLAFALTAIGSRQVSVAYVVVAIVVALGVGSGYWIYQVRRLDRIASGLLVVERDINVVARIAFDTILDSDGLALTWQQSFWRGPSTKGLPKLLLAAGIPVLPGSLQFAEKTRSIKSASPS